MEGVCCERVFGNDRGGEVGVDCGGRNGRGGEVGVDSGGRDCRGGEVGIDCDGSGMIISAGHLFKRKL